MRGALTPRVLSRYCPRRVVVGLHQTACWPLPFACRSIGPRQARILTGVPVTATAVAGAPRRCSVGIELDCAKSLSAKGLRRFAGRHGVCERQASCNAFDYSNPI